mgnify:CR=1 FL=1
MFETWPDESGLARRHPQGRAGGRPDHAGDRPPAQRRALRRPVDSADIYALATQLDDIIDDTEEAADFMGLYQIEAPMEQAHELLEHPGPVLRAGLGRAAPTCAGSRTSSRYWIEIHRLENEGDRVWREALASLFSNGIDPMVVIRWKDIFGLLERAIDSTETAAAHDQGAIAVKHA